MLTIVKYYNFMKFVKAYILYINIGDVAIEIGKNSRGLSWEIDKKLDAELKQDVKLNATQWQTVFDYITEDQAEQDAKQNTFDKEKDKDVNDWTQYVVHQGQYIIKEGVWNQILSFAKSVMGMEEASADDIKKDSEAVVNTEETLPEKETDEQIKSNITNWLSEIDINFEVESDRFKMDIIEKYKTTKESDVKKQIIQNYAKGWKIHVFEQMSIQGNYADKTYSSDCSKAKTVDELKTSYDEFAKEYISYYDLDNNGEISQEEFLFYQARDYYRYQQGEGKNLSREEAVKKAKQIVTAYENGTLKPNENGTSEEKLLAGIINYVEFVDRGTLQKSDGTTTGNDKKMSVDEVKAYLLAMAQFEDKKNDITSSEVRTFSMAMMSRQGTSDYNTADTKFKQAYDFLNK